MRFKKFVLPVLCAAVCALSLAACTPTQNSPQDGSQNTQSSRNTQNVTAPYIDKEQPDTWFEWKKNNLPTLAQCQQIQTGMSLNDVILKIGRPQRDIGYGAWVLQFDIRDGGALTISFALGDGQTLYDRLHAVALGFDSPIPTTAFSELYSWAAELSKDDIVKVRRELGYIGVAPGSLKDIDYSTDEGDIENAYALLSSPLTPVSGREEYTGGGYVQYDFYTADRIYSVKITNGFVQVGDAYYRFNGGCTFENAELSLHAFTTEDNPVFESYTIYGSAGEKIGEYTGLGKFEFVAYDGIYGAPAYRLESAAVNLIIYSADIFAVEGESGIYKIAGGENFGFLFE